MGAEVTIPFNLSKRMYRGYRFRSRLEARWAVFFDRCSVRYDYEHEGFELPSGRYLPDFHFKRWGGFLEVKPAGLLPKRYFEFDQPYLTRSAMIFRARSFLVGNYIGLWESDRPWR